MPGTPLSKPLSSGPHHYTYDKGTMLILESAPALIPSAFCFEDAILLGIGSELNDATQDTGPLDSESAEDIERLRDAFYGPIASTPCYSSDADTAPSTPFNPSADESNLMREVFGGDSSLSSAPPSRPSSPTKTSRKRRNRKKSRAKRTKARREEREKDVEATRHPKSRSIKLHVAPAEKTAVEYSAEDIPCASTGYVATIEPAGRVHSLPELLAMGFELVKWDASSSKPIVDSNGLVVAVLVSKPKDPSWGDVHNEAFELLRSAAPRCGFTKKSASHRRGKFDALNVGISFGGGPQKPGNLSHAGQRSAELKALLESPCFVRLAGFASSAFSTWMPKLHRHYETCLEAVMDHDPALHRNFENSVWAAAAFNFGPRTVTVKHRDAANLPFGICSVTALGRYDYLKGGHIVLWEFGLVVEFPPGSTILIPSAAVSHSNTPVGPDEERCSFTQYSAGGLFRWVDQGFQKSHKYYKSLSDAELAKLPELNKARCALGLSLFSTLEDLIKSPT